MSLFHAMILPYIMLYLLNYTALSKLHYTDTITLCHYVLCNYSTLHNVITCYTNIITLCNYIMLT